MTLLIKSRAGRDWHEAKFISYDGQPLRIKSICNLLNKLPDEVTIGNHEKPTCQSCKKQRALSSEGGNS